MIEESIKDPILLSFNSSMNQNSGNQLKKVTTEFFIIYFAGWVSWQISKRIDLSWIGL